MKQLYSEAVGNIIAQALKACDLRRGVGVVVMDAAGYMLGMKADETGQMEKTCETKQRDRVYFPLWLMLLPANGKPIRLTIGADDCGCEQTVAGILAVEGAAA